MQRWTRPCELRQVASSLLLEVGAAHHIEFIGPNLTIVALNDAQLVRVRLVSEYEFLIASRRKVFLRGEQLLTASKV